VGIGLLKEEGESKIIRNVDTCCAVGYTAGCVVYLSPIVVDQM
jgi:hypothetical protein